MATISPTNDGLDWGSFPDAASLPNANGADTQSPNVVVGARAFVPGDGYYTCTDATQNDAAWSLTGSLSGGGGGAAVVGPFSVSAVAVGSNFGQYGGGVWVAPRAGSITAASGYLGAAAADDDITAIVYDATQLSPVFATLTFSNGGNTSAYGTASAGSYPVAAGDVVLFLVTGGGSLSNTPAFSGSFEFTPS